jgi:transcriptional regulator with XRE-family HTH domain
MTSDGVSLAKGHGRPPDGSKSRWPVRRRQLDVTLGGRLRVCRWEHGYSLTFLANILETSKGYLSELERGLKAPSPSTVRKLVLALPTMDLELAGALEQAAVSPAARVHREAARRIRQELAPEGPRSEHAKTAGLSSDSWPMNMRFSRLPFPLRYDERGLLQSTLLPEEVARIEEHMRHQVRVAWAGPKVGPGLRSRVP